jgi:hypothetical protein
MRPAVAEVGKLARPLSYGVAGAAAAFCVLLAAGGAHNAEINVQGAPAARAPCGPAPGPCGRPGGVIRPACGQRPRTRSTAGFDLLRGRPGATW